MRFKTVYVLSVLTDTPENWEEYSRWDSSEDDNAYKYAMRDFEDLQNKLAIWSRFRLEVRRVAY